MFGGKCNNYQSPQASFSELSSLKPKCLISAEIKNRVRNGVRLHRYSNAAGSQSAVGELHAIDDDRRVWTCPRGWRTSEKERFPPGDGGTAAAHFRPETIHQLCQSVDFTPGSCVFVCKMKTFGWRAAARWNASVTTLEPELCSVEETSRSIADVLTWR